jgi:hypothetical protein
LYCLNVTHAFSILPLNYAKVILRSVIRFAAYPIHRSDFQSHNLYYEHEQRTALCIHHVLKNYRLCLIFRQSDGNSSLSHRKRKKANDKIIEWDQKWWIEEAEKEIDVIRMTWWSLSWRIEDGAVRLRASNVIGSWDEEVGKKECERESGDVWADVNWNETFIVSRTTSAKYFDEYLTTESVKSTYFGWHAVHQVESTLQLNLHYSSSFFGPPLHPNAFTSNSSFLDRIMCPKFTFVTCVHRGPQRSQCCNIQHPLLEMI